MKQSQTSQQAVVLACAQSALANMPGRRGDTFQTTIAIKFTDFFTSM